MSIWKVKNHTDAEYIRPRNASFLRDQCCKVESGQVSSYREIQVNRTYRKFSDSYSFAAVEANLIRKALLEPQGVISRRGILAEW